MRNFFEEFETADKKSWIEEALKSIKGQTLELLQTHTYEGIKLEPFYTFEDLPTQATVIPTGKNWKNRVKISGNIPSDIERLTAEAVNSGADSVVWSISDKNFDQFIAELNTFLSEPFEKCVYFENPKQKEIEALAYTNFTGKVLNDCLTKYAFQVIQLDDQWNSISQSINTTFQKSIYVNIAPFHNAGANAVEELAVALSQMVEYANQLTEKGINPQKIFDQMEVSFAIGSHYFMEIAKLRAFRLLIIAIQKAFQINEPTPTFVHAETSLWNKSYKDSYNNLLRMTTEAMSAAIGGANAITVQPFNDFFEIADDFSRRIARNIPIILKEEVHLDKVADIAKGAYFIENLTQQLVQKAWQLFQSWEEAGGYIASIHQNRIQTKILQTAQTKKQDFEEGKIVLVGVNKYPNKNETIQPITTTPLPPTITSFQLLQEQRLEII